MANYYCMIAGLPDIDLQDAKPGMTVEQMREQCGEQLTSQDKKLLFYFFLHFDCINLVKLLKNPEANIDQWGNFTHEQLQDLITSATELNFNVHRFPAFMSIFAREYAFNKDKADYFPEDEIAFQFLNYAIRTCPNRMMRRWYKLNLDITNILTAMLARTQGWSVGDFVKGEGEVQEMIRENKTKDFNLTHELEYIPQLMKIVEEDDPVRKEKMIDAFKWVWLDERTFFEPFSMEAVFAYLCKLQMQERWAKLDVEQGKETFQRIIDNLRGEARVPDEFLAQSKQ
ncbi:MAG: DUF2764 family protein [Bacteroidaceae bacterium]|nr:DUF2764 family protein [Bacteroidaceae bacterium]MBQ2300262.1 DUF2764 family protein [Bacteroidaceae bacterium]MBR0543724.1 DUF2764 family protein [Bacteroidaceae bacterium]